MSHTLRRKKLDSTNESLVVYKCSRRAILVSCVVDLAISKFQVWVDRKCKDLLLLILAHWSDMILTAEKSNIQPCVPHRLWAAEVTLQHLLCVNKGWLLSHEMVVGVSDLWNHKTETWITTWHVTRVFIVTKNIWICCQWFFLRMQFSILCKFLIYHMRSSFEAAVNVTFPHYEMWSI